jgi:branched-chain amino acid transport system substrate-binding protein
MFHALRRAARVRGSKGFVVLGLLGAALVASAAVASARTQADTITVCSILDATGPINIYGKPMIDSTKLAIADINKHGGVGGQQLKLIQYDGQSSNDKYTQFANECALQDHAAVIMGGITSASREAMRPVIDRTKTLYFYNEQYEGGVCDKYVFDTGVVPSQQLRALIPYVIKRFGKKLYVPAADYNYGHISAAWVEKYAKQYGGQVVGTDYIPLDVTDFASTINKIQSLKPDVVLSLLVGGNHIAFYRQFYSAGLGSTIHIASPTFGLGNEQVVLAPSEQKDLVVAYPYFQELSTPSSKAFRATWAKAEGAKYPYITDSAATVWTGWHLWAAAANKAKTTDRDAVIKQLESGMTFNAPSGRVKMNPGSHHLTQNVSIAVTNGRHGFKILSTANAVPPSYENSVCNLVKDPNQHKQFTP